MGTKEVFAIKYSHDGFVPLSGETVGDIPIAMQHQLRDDRDMLPEWVTIHRAESEVDAKGKRIFGTFCVHEPVFQVLIETARRAMLNLAKEIGW